MSFLNPLLLFGLGAVASPIIIHLLMNRKVKRVVWAAMRFLQASVQKNQKRMNLEDLILLAVRCLLLILLALALARPIFPGMPGMGGSAETAVIALDNSYSMAQTSGGGESLFDQARAAAEEVIDSLPTGSSVALFLFSDAVQKVIAEPTYDLDLARKMVRDAAVSDRATDVAQVVSQARDLLGERGAGPRTIYLITDGQAAAWEPFETIRASLADGEFPAHIILVGNVEEQNLSVSDLRLESAMAAVGEALQFDVEVSNFGMSEGKDVTVRLNVDDESPSDEGVIDSIPPGAAKSISLFTQIRAPGYHTVTAEISPDHLPADDRRTIALRAADDVRVLLVDGKPAPEPRDAETFYLRHALAPVAPAAREAYPVKTETIGPAQVNAIKLGDFDAVVLANVSALSQAATDALALYLERGGGLIIFPGDRTDANFYNEVLGKQLGFLPASLGQVRGGEDGPFLTLQDKDYAHRIVSLWNDVAAGTLATAQFHRSFEMTPITGHTDRAGEPRVVVKFADGTPAIMERTWGRGRVILFSSTANASWNDLPLRPAFVPLVSRTLGAILDRQDARLNIPVGAPFEFVSHPDWVNRDAIITAPGETGGGSLRRTELADGVPLLRFHETGKAGAYGVAVKSDPPAALKFAAQFNPSESRLAALSQAQLDSLAPAQVTRRTSGEQFAGSLSRERGGTELWALLGILVVAVACVELAMAGIFSASK